MTTISPSVERGRLVFTGMADRDTTAKTMKADGWTVRRTVVNNLVGFDLQGRTYEKRYHLAFHRFY